MLKRSMVETEGAINDVTISYIHVSCWISKATCTYVHAQAHMPGYTHVCASMHTRPMCNTCYFSTATVIHECASMLCYMYIAHLV